MPGAPFHSHYWAGSVDVPAEPSLGASASGGYVPWMTTITAVAGSVVFAVAAWL